MEQFVKSLFDRLDSKRQGQLICIMDNAINEMHNNGIISLVDASGTSKLHDPDPIVRVTEKTLLARSVGKTLVVSSEPIKTEKGIGYAVKINNDPKFPNSAALCIQGGLEGLYQAGIFRKNKSGVMDYKVVVDDRGEDCLPLVENICVLNDLYDVFDIHIAYSTKDNDIEKPQKKKGLFAKIFGK